MNAVVKDKWVRALRSGEYAQGMYSLKDTAEGITRYCCLGVLCDLHSKETGNQWSEEDDYLEEDTSLPPEVIEWAGLDSDLPHIRSLDTNLATINDGDGHVNSPFRAYSFQEIADLIEQNL